MTSSPGYKCTFVTWAFVTKADPPLDFNTFFLCLWDWTQFSNHVLMPPRLDRLPKEMRSDERMWQEASSQWAADYMAYAFSNLIKQGAVHRVKTLAVL